MFEEWFELFFEVDPGKSRVHVPIQVMLFIFLLMICGTLAQGCSCSRRCSMKNCCRYRRQPEEKKALTAAQKSWQRATRKIVELLKLRKVWASIGKKLQAKNLVRLTEHLERKKGVLAYKK